MTPANRHSVPFLVTAHGGATHWRLYPDGTSEWVRLPEDDEWITFDSDDPEDVAKWLRDA